MKIFFDTEFTGLYKNTTLISIGLVADNNQKFYAELIDFNTEQCDDWIQNNVLDNLFSVAYRKCEEVKYIPGYHIGTKDEISIALQVWLSQFDYVELVSDCCHYDMVLFIDLFGGAFNIPKNVVPVCYDINQDIASYFGISAGEAFNYSREEILYNKYHTGPIIEDLSIDQKHNALYDAMVIREIYHMINDEKGIIQNE